MLLSLLFLTMALLLLLQSSRVQTYIARRVAADITARLGTTVSIDQIHIRFFDAADVYGFYVEDQHHDTLLYCGRVYANINGFFLDLQQLDFDRVDLINTAFYLVQYPGEEDLNIQFLLDILDPPGPPSTTPKEPFKLFFWEVNLRNVQFSYLNNDVDYPVQRNTMDYDHLLFDIEQGRVREFRIVEDSLSGRIQNWKIKEQCGFSLSSLNTDIIVSSTMMHFNRFNAYFGGSQLQGNILLDYERYGELSEFVTDVFLRADIQKSRLRLDDLAFFSKELDGFDLPIELSGQFKGTIDDFVGKQVRINIGQATRLTGDLKMSGLPDFNTTDFALRIQELYTTASDLERIPNYPFANKERIKLPKELFTLGKIQYKGTLNGRIDDCTLVGVLETEAGLVNANMHVHQDRNFKQMAYSGNIEAANVQLGKLLSNQRLGGLSLTFSFNGMGTELNTAQIAANGKIDYFEFQNYTFKNVVVDGALNKQMFEGRIISSDENAQFDFDGLVDLSIANPRYLFRSQINYLNLTKSQLVSMDSTLSVRGSVEANFTGNQLDNLAGNFNLFNFSVKWGNQTFPITHFALNAQISGGERLIGLKSQLADAELKGNFSFDALTWQVKQYINSYLPSMALFANEKNTSAHKAEAKGYIQINDFRLAETILLPGIHFSGGSTIQFSLNQLKDQLDVKATLPEFNAMGYRLYNATVQSIGNSDAIDARLKAERIKLTDSLSLYKIQMQNSLSADTINSKFLYSNHANTDDEAEINTILVLKPNRLDLEILPSYIFVSDSVWVVNEGNHITIEGKRIAIRDLSFEHNEQFVRLNGLISPNEADELDIILSEFRLSTFNSLLKESGTSIRGRTNGLITLNNLYGSPYFKSNLNIKRFGVDDIIYGTLDIRNVWNESAQSVGINATLRPQETEALVIKGQFSPYRKENNLELDIQFNRFQISPLKIYLSDIFSSLEGFATGQIRVRGSSNKPEVSGILNLQRGRFTVDYLNATYSISNGVDILVYKDEIRLRNCTLRDNLKGGTGILNFSLKHKNFSDMQVDMSVDMDNLLAMNTNATQNDLFYGTAYATGTFRLSGPTNKLQFDIIARTERGTSFSLPLYGASEVTQDSYITFINSKDTLQTQKAIAKINTEPAGFNINITLTVTPDAEAILIFDPTVGDMIQANGTGNLRITLTPDGEFNMFGDYTVNQGSYLFTLENIISKRFEVQKGSTIKWYGDPLNADVDIKAAYSINTPIYPLVKQIDTSAITRKPVPVQANLVMTNKLLNPDIRFSIELPNSDQNTRDLVRSQIQTEDELNKQFFGILVLGQFLPNTGGTGESTSLNSSIAGNLSEFLSSQLSNWLNQYTDNVNIGLNYRSNSATGTEEINVMVSKEFNNRFVFDGNVGMLNNNTVQTGNNFIGEFNLEYKVTEDGRFRLKAFNRSNQYNLINNEFPYTQGVGVFYRTEFDRFGDLWRRRSNEAKE